MTDCKITLSPDYYARLIIFVTVDTTQVLQAAEKLEDKYLDLYTPNKHLKSMP